MSISFTRERSHGLFLPLLRELPIACQCSPVPSECTVAQPPITPTGASGGGYGIGKENRNVEGGSQPPGSGFTQELYRCDVPSFRLPNGPKSRAPIKKSRLPSGSRDPIHTLHFAERLRNQSAIAQAPESRTNQRSVAAADEDYPALPLLPA